MYQNYMNENIERVKPLQDTDIKNLQQALYVINKIMNTKEIRSEQIYLLEKTIENLKEDYEEYNEDIEKKIDNRKKGLKRFNPKKL